MKRWLWLTGGVVAVYMVGIATLGYLAYDKPDNSPVSSVEAPQRTIYAEKPKPLSIDEIHRLVNEERVKAGVEPLTIDPRLVRGAEKKAAELAVGNYMTSNPHRNLDDFSGFLYSVEEAPECANQPAGGENLSFGHRTEASAVAGWMGSEPHMKAMMNSRVKYVGYASGGIYIVQHLCYR